MVALGCLLGLLALQQPPALSYKNGVFTSVVAGKQEQISIKADDLSPKKIFMFQIGRRWLVWDDRGLTVRVGSKSTTTRLPEIAVTPKLFSRDEILDTVAKFKTKARNKEANAVSGIAQDGNTLYLLARWDETASKAPWLEAVVKVDMSQPTPKPQLVGRFVGFTRSRGSLIGNELRLMDGELIACTEMDEGWGFSVLNIDTAEANFTKIGRGVQAVSLQPSAKRILFIEKTSYGTRLGGVARIPGGERRELLETRDPFRFLSGPNLIAVVTTKEGIRVRSIETGSELALPSAVGLAPVSTGILVWVPKDKPVRAAIYDARRWSGISRWELNPPKPAQPAPKGSAAPLKPRGMPADRPPRG